MGDEIFYIVIIASFMFFFLSFFIVYIAVFHNKRKLIFKQELLRTQLEIQEQTLKTISEEIHDNVGQVLSLAKLNLNTVIGITDQQVQLKIDSTKDLVSKAINDLRDLSRSLHGEKIGEIGLQEAIGNELKILQNTGQFETVLNISGNAYKLDSQKEMVLFRIVQEALHNSVKHAKADLLQVQMNYQPAVFTLTISDDGLGFDPATLHVSKTGIGLKSMQNRAALIGGTYAIHSSKNNGTSISVEIPYIQS